MPREDFPGNSLRVKRGVITCLSCASVKVTPLLDRLIFASENLDTETTEVDMQNRFLPAVLCSSLSDFYYFNIPEDSFLTRREFPGKSSETEIFPREY